MLCDDIEVGMGRGEGGSRGRNTCIIMADSCFCMQKQIKHCKAIFFQLKHKFKKYFK